MSLELYAGKLAYQRIKEEGLTAQQVRLIVGASGGPKWLVLSKLDQYLNDAFLKEADHPIELIGSSIGSWRMACYAQKEPSKAIERLRDAYSTTEYPGKPTAKDVSESAQSILDHALGIYGEHQSHHDFIVSNKQRPLNVVTVRNRRLFNHPSNLVQGVSIGLAAMANPVSSRFVERLFPRVVFSQSLASSPYRDVQVNERVQLSSENLAPALMASGAIPFVLEPIRVPGSKARWHWDGGLVDYHFEGPFMQEQDLVLYPHFFPNLIPGWLDKGLPWRRAKPGHYDNVVVMCPSKTFIDALPDSHIPDRKDFSSYENSTRINNWQKVIKQSEQLVDALHDGLSKDGGRSLVKPLEQMPQG
ncbi:patatin-like phospholipase family protein [Litoribrevibacter euphylliae]|uniref:Patatin-like phospholipase family protein n=1 Tax=Litoribrevibacter euphylliae TaxID=1834034 RepID=A0ABV7HI53_9GAMM